MRTRLWLSGILQCTSTVLKKRWFVGTFFSITKRNHSQANHAPENRYQPGLVTAELGRTRTCQLTLLRWQQWRCTSARDDPTRAESTGHYDSYLPVSEWLQTLTYSLKRNKVRAHENSRNFTRFKDRAAARLVHAPLHMSLASQRGPGAQ